MNKQDEFEKDATQQRAADGLENFMLYISSPWRVIWVNFLAGVFKGLGTVVGASIVIGLTIWVLSLFKQVPFVGSYANEMESVVEGYMYEIDYNDELGRVTEILERIEESLKEPRTLPASE
jgi:hypothetical protein